MTDQTIQTIDEQLLNQGLEDDQGGADQGGEAKQDDVLELGGDDAPELTPEQKAEEQRKSRSRDPIQRINQLTARLRDAERRAAELEAKTAPKVETPAEEQTPDASKYEFGEADPQFIKDTALFEVRKQLREEREAAAKGDAEQKAKAEVITKISDGMANVERAGAEKYDDFADKIAEAVEARDGEPLHPMIGIGIAVSPAGADVAYRLATDEAASTKIEQLVKTNPQAAAVAFGELEGEFIDSDDDLNLADHLDMARMLGRMKARLAGKGGQSKAVDPAAKITKAPKPAARPARGTSGQFEVSDDTEDFSAFEAKHMRRKG